MGTTNILDLNNRLSKVEKENVAQNSYTSLKNKPKINNVTLTGNKALADIGAASAADVGDKTQLNTVDKSSIVNAINEVNTKANTYGTYTVSNATDIKDFFLKLATLADNDLSTKPDYVLYNIIGYYENEDLFYGVINRIGVHRYFFTFTKSFGSKLYCGYVDVTNSSVNVYEYTGTVI